MTNEQAKGEFNAVISGVLIPELIRIADKYNYNRDSMIKFAADTLTAMSELSTFERYKALEQQLCDDTISRQAAIDIERNATVDTTPSHFEAHQKFAQYLDDAEITSFGRWQWANGFNTALTAVVIDLRKLPSAQSEIIRCEECMHNGSFDTDCPIRWNGKEYCSFAERGQYHK